MPNQMNHFYKLIATFFGLGYAPVAPGTFGALGGFLISLVCWYAGMPSERFLYIHIFLILVSYMAGVYAVNKLKEEWGHDPSRVVIDETLGFWVSIIFLPINWNVLLSGFILFRFFDILKPLGIRKIDQMNSPHSVMLDDVAAGIFANAVLQVAVCFF
jgi:phosphatidylglycerophosphatase A